jgi:hypothetical protein
MGEDLVDHRHLGDEGNDAHRAVAARARQRVHLEDLLKEGHRGAFAQRRLASVGASRGSGTMAGGRDGSGGDAGDPAEQTAPMQTVSAEPLRGCPVVTTDARKPVVEHAAGEEPVGDSVAHHPRGARLTWLLLRGITARPAFYRVRMQRNAARRRRIGGDGERNFDWGLMFGVASYWRNAQDVLGRRSLLRPPFWRS